eukprot:751755-Hanusia_phi.AAC.2
MWHAAGSYFYMKSEVRDPILREASSVLDEGRHQTALLHDPSHPSQGRERNYGQFESLSTSSLGPTKLSPNYLPLATPGPGTAG